MLHLWGEKVAGANFKYVHTLYNDPGLDSLKSSCEITPAYTKEFNTTTKTQAVYLKTGFSRWFVFKLNVIGKHTDFIS